MFILLNVDFKNHCEFSTHLKQTLYILHISKYFFYFFFYFTYFSPDDLFTMNTKIIGHPLSLRPIQPKNVGHPIKGNSLYISSFLI